MGQVVVGAAILRGDRVLAGRRTSPARDAGRWELPGGKVEPGESDGEALVREIREELGVGVRVERWLPAEQPLAGGRMLRVAVARLCDPETEPHSRVHDRLSWLRPDELADVDWLDADRPFLELVNQAVRARRR